MKRALFFVGALALAALIAVAIYFKENRRVSLEATSSGAGLTAEERERISEFWKVYREARALHLEGGWEEAIPRYLRALELDAAHEDTLYNLAGCHFELDRFAEALGFLERLVGANPLSHRGHRQIGVIHACPLAGPLFDLEAAERSLARAFEINKEESGALLRLAEVALVRGDTDRAVELFDLANRSNFRAVEGYYLRAYVLWTRGEAAESRRLLAEAVRQSRKPVVVAGVPGEGDTRAGSRLPPTTATGKLLIRPFWSGLLERYPEDVGESEPLDAEFEPLVAYLRDLRARLE